MIMILVFFSDAFHKQPVEIDLVMACVGELNTTLRSGIPFPIIYGCGKLKRIHFSEMFSFKINLFSGDSVVKHYNK
jgi:hypothetical protein